MRIINDRGMIFGKINIIDFLVLLFILCLMPMFYFGYKILTKPPLPPPTTITLDKAEYEQRQSEQKAKYKKKVAECEKLKSQRDNLLKEHKRLKRYF